MFEDDYIDTDQQGGEDVQPQNDGHQDDGAAGPKPKDETVETLREMRAELKNLRTRLTETETDARYWRDQIKGGNKPEAEAEDEDEEISVSDDLLEAFSSGDPKRVTKVMREMGFTREKDVQKAIGSTRAEMTAQAALYGKYPDLEDPQSEFFQATAAIYNELAQDPAFKKSGKTIEVAARMAAAELGTGSAARPKSRRDADNIDDDDERETDRARRVAAQSGERGRPRSRSGRSAGSEDEAQELTAMQRNIIAKFRAAGSSVTEEGYSKRASSGIRMSGLPRGRR